MFAIRDSQEPEDPIDDADIFPVSPSAPATDPTPISFDLPSTTSIATQPPSSTSNPTQKSKPSSNAKTKPPKRRRTIDDEGLGDEHENIWEFPSETPPASKTRRSRTVVEPPSKANEVEESPVPRKSARRNSLSVVSEIMVTQRAARQSPTVEHNAKKCRRSRRIEESETEEIESAVPDALEDSDEASQLAIGTDTTESQITSHEVIVIDSSPRKRAVAVEIPVKRSQRTKSKKPLKEIVPDNIPSPDPSPAKVSIQIQETSAPTEPPEELENVVLANAASTPPRETVTEKVKRNETSPPRQMNVASILAKSPNRPVYRVGLSKRVNVEPLHGYLKRKAM